MNHTGGWMGGWSGGGMWIWAVLGVVIVVLLVRRNWQDVQEIVLGSPPRRK